MSKQGSGGIAAYNSKRKSNIKMFRSYLAKYWTSPDGVKVYGVEEGDKMVPASVIADWIYAMMTGEFPKGGFKEYGGARGVSRDKDEPYSSGAIANMISSLRTHYGSKFYGELNPCDSFEVKVALKTASKKLGNGRRHAAFPLTDAVVVEMMRELDFENLEEMQMCVWLNVGTKLGTRVSELFFMDADDFKERQDNGRILGFAWTLGWSKNDQDAKGFLKGVKHASHCLHGSGHSAECTPNFKNPESRCSACMLKWWFTVLKRKDPAGWSSKLFRKVTAGATVAGPGGLEAGALEPSMFTKMIRKIITRVNIKRSARKVKLYDLGRATSHGMRRGAVSDFYRLMTECPGTTDLLQIANFFRFRCVSSMLRYIEHSDRVDRVSY